LDDAQDSSKTTTGRRSEVETGKRGEAPKETTQGKAKQSPVKKNHPLLSALKERNLFPQNHLLLFYRSNTATMTGINF